MTGVRGFDASRRFVVTPRPADGPALARLRIAPAPAVFARLLTWLLLLAPATSSIVGRLRPLLTVAPAAPARLPLALLIAGLLWLAFRGRFRRLGFVPPGSQASFLYLLTTQLVVLAGRTVRLAAALVARLSALATLAALTALSTLALVATRLALAALTALARTLVGALPGLTVGAVTRLPLRPLRLIGAGFTDLRLVSGPVLRSLLGAWAPSAPTALAGSLR